MSHFSTDVHLRTKLALLLSENEFKIYFELLLSRPLTSANLSNNAIPSGCRLNKCQCMECYAGTDKADLQATIRVDAHFEEVKIL